MKDAITARVQNEGQFCAEMETKTKGKRETLEKRKVHRIRLPVEDA